MDIQKASYQELKDHREEVNARMKELEHDAIETLQNQAASFGFTLLKHGLGLKSIKPKVKYSDGNGNSWSGRGRKPAWIAEAEAAGTDIEGYRVA